MEFEMTEQEKIEMDQALAAAYESLWHLFCEWRIDLYDHKPNRRVAHLALHGKSKLVRKKNMNRMLRYTERRLSQ